MLSVILYLTFYAIGLTLSLLASFIGLIQVFGFGKENLILELILLPGVLAMTAYSFNYATENIARFANMATYGCRLHVLMRLRSLYALSTMKTRGAITHKYLSFSLVKAKSECRDVYFGMRVVDSAATPRLRKPL